MTDAGGPKQEEVTRITNAVVDSLGTCDLESALTVLCSILGQLVAAMSEGRPSSIQEAGNCVAENVKKAAISKLLHDDELRRNKK